MRAPNLVRELFGRFQNLNLAILREDLRRGLVVRGNWSSGGRLCPLAHGLTDGQTVREICCVSQSYGLDEACAEVARHLNASHPDVYRFVRRWDDFRFAPEWFLEQLDLL